MTNKLVNDYIAALDKAKLLVEAVGTSNAKVTGVSFNSKDVVQGTLFVCKGAHFKQDYLEEAIAAGAVAYVSETAYDVEGAGAILVKDIRAAMPVLAMSFYGNLSEKIKMLGITGTKGKTSTTYFVKSIFNSYMRSVGGKMIAFCSGIDNYDGIKLAESHLTTPENLDLFRYMNNAVESGVEYMVMEVSSQALKYGRVDGVDYEAVCLLNIGSDHISPVEHSSLEDYMQSKLLLLGKTKVACINLDSDYQNEIMEAASQSPKLVTFSRKNPGADVYAYDIKSEAGRVYFNVRIRETVMGTEPEGQPDFSGEEYSVELGAFSTINVENALAAISIATAMGVPVANIQEGLKDISVPGRLELIKSKDGKRLAVVDYAHNQLSYETLFNQLGQDLPGKEFIIVFGAPGMKAYSRREDLGRVAGRYAKLSILTEEDAGEESAANICREIARYVYAEGGAAEIVVDRGEAIRRAFEVADDNTVVIVAGKGRETWMKRGLDYVETPSDVEWVHKYINMERDD